MDIFHKTTVSTDPLSRNPPCVSKSRQLRDLQSLNIIVLTIPLQSSRVPKGAFYCGVWSFKSVRIIAFYVAPYSHKHWVPLKQENIANETTQKNQEYPQDIDTCLLPFYMKFSVSNLRQGMDINKNLTKSNNKLERKSNAT